MGSQYVVWVVFALLLLCVSIPEASYAQFGYYGPAARAYSINGFGGSNYYWNPSINRGPIVPQARTFSPRPFYPTTRPYTYHINQYYHIEYNKPGRVGWPEAPTYYNAGPHLKSRAWYR